MARRLLHLGDMKKLLLFLAGALAITGGVLGRRARRRLTGRGMTEGARRTVTEGGLADVDPGPLMSMGEGIDRDAVAEAHRSVRDQRAKLPRL